MVKGYSTNPTAKTEILYAVYDDGRVYQTHEITRTDMFNEDDREWFLSERNALDCEISFVFVGEYKARV